MWGIYYKMKMNAPYMSLVFRMLPFVPLLIISGEPDAEKFHFVLHLSLPAARSHPPLFCLYQLTCCCSQDKLWEFNLSIPSVIIVLFFASIGTHRNGFVLILPRNVSVFIIFSLLYRFCIRLFIWLIRFSEFDLVGNHLDFCFCLFTTEKHALCLNHNYVPSLLCYSTILISIS